MRPVAQYRGKGERGEPMPPDPAQARARGLAADAIRGMVGPKCPTDPDVIAQTAIAAYILARAEQGYSDPEIKAALSSERPWGLLRVFDSNLQAEAVARAALPVLGEIATQVDPTGERRFFDWAKDDVMRLVEAAIYVWEESQGRRHVAHGIVPADAYSQPAQNPPDPHPQLVMAGAVHPATRYRGPIIDDEIPFAPEMRV